MFVGIDVYHDASNKGRSCLAVVGSVDPAITKWYSTVQFQQPNQEISTTLQQAVIECVSKYRASLGSVPERIFIYRDGVGDGQLSVVKDFEASQITQGLADFMRINEIPGPRPKVTVTVVQKRVNTKIFVQRGSNNFENPAAGSVVDRDVTKPSIHDFYLISQHVTQGTVTPTHYVTLMDENGIIIDRLQRLAYKMTHLYYNWTGTIRGDYHLAIDSISINRFVVQFPRRASTRTSWPTWLARISDRRFRTTRCETNCSTCNRVQLIVFLVMRKLS